MPTLDWIGKASVVNHHRRVGYHLMRCDRELSAGDADAGNLLVQGDNLPAGGNVLTHAVAQDLPAHPLGKGPRVVYGEACRLGPKSFAHCGIAFRQVPFELKAD